MTERWSSGASRCVLGVDSPCVLVLETSGPFPRSGENPPEQVKALDAVLGEELEPWQVLYKVLDPILF